MQWCVNGSPCGRSRSCFLVFNMMLPKTHSDSRFTFQPLLSAGLPFSSNMNMSEEVSFLTHLFGFYIIHAFTFVSCRIWLKCDQKRLNPGQGVLKGQAGRNKKPGVCCEFLQWATINTMMSHISAVFLSLSLLLMPTRCLEY